MKLLMISQQWFIQWLGAVKQQAITWWNAYQVYIAQRRHWATMT